MARSRGGHSRGAGPPSTAGPAVSSRQGSAGAAHQQIAPTEPALMGTAGSRPTSRAQSWPCCRHRAHRGPHVPDSNQSVSACVERPRPDGSVGAPRAVSSPRFDRTVLGPTSARAAARPSLARRTDDQLRLSIPGQVRGGQARAESPAEPSAKARRERQMVAPMSSMLMRKTPASAAGTPSASTPSGLTDDQIEGHRGGMRASTSRPSQGPQTGAANASAMAAGLVHGQAGGQQVDDAGIRRSPRRGPHRQPPRRTETPLGEGALNTADPKRSPSSPPIMRPRRSSGPCPRLKLIRQAESLTTDEIDRPRFRPSGRSTRDRPCRSHRHQQQEPPRTELPEALGPDGWTETEDTSRGASEARVSAWPETT